jgi:hypothetical protein
MALREAVLIAKKRGETRQFMYEPGMICNFVIYCPGIVAHVRIKRVTRVHCDHAWIEQEAADALMTLRAIASGSGISRELWVFLPRGAFRFFRVEDAGLVELDRDGEGMPEKANPVPLAQPAIAGQTSIPPDQVTPPKISVGVDPSEKGKVAHYQPFGKCPNWKTEPV